MSSTVNHDGSAHGSPLCRTELQENKARVQSDEFQAAEFELEELCNANHVVYETFDVYESSAETHRRRVRLKTKIRRFVFFSYAKIEELRLFSQYHYLSISLNRKLWKIH